MSSLSKFEAMKVAVVIPAYNEEATIGQVVAAVRKHNLDAIVFDDGSSDDTASLADSAGAIVISGRGNGGYDAAINSGFLAAAELEYAYVITMDADGQHPAELLPEYVRLFQAGVDCVAGNRSSFGRWSEHLFSFVAGKLWGVHDPLCGMKGYSLQLWRQRGAFDRYHSVGTELLIYAVKKGFRVAELPVCVRERDDRSRFGSGLKPNLVILRALLRALLSR